MEATMAPASSYATRIIRVRRLCRQGVKWKDILRQRRVAASRADAETHCCANEEVEAFWEMTLGATVAERCE